MVVDPFGAVSLPSCSNFTLRHTAKENEDEIGGAVENTMRHNFYVDDCLRSAKQKQMVRTKSPVYVKHALKADFD